MAASDRVPVSGSERTLTPGHTRVGDVDLSPTSTLTVYVRPRAPVDWVDAESARAPTRRRLVAREDWADAHGAADEDMTAGGDFARRRRAHASSRWTPRGAPCISVGRCRRRPTPSGPRWRAATRPPKGTGEYRARSGALTVPAALGDVVTGVFGIDDRPQARPQLRRHAQAAAGRVVHAGAGGRGLRVPVGGDRQGPDRRRSSSSAAASAPPTSTTYFQGLGLTAPSVTAVSVDGGQNSPGTDPNADGEVMLDIEVVGAVAPGVADRRLLRAQHRPGVHRRASRPRCTTPRTSRRWSR